MTAELISSNLIDQLRQQLPDGFIQAEKQYLLVEADHLIEVAEIIRHTPGVEIDYLSLITATDYADYIEVSYLFYSLAQNHHICIKVRCKDKAHPSIPSLTGIWAGADLQEREAFDLLGVVFTGHPNMQRIFLWEGFEGHPLRKDFNNGD